MPINIVQIAQYRKLSKNKPINGTNKTAWKQVKEYNAPDFATSLSLPYAFVVADPIANPTKASKLTREVTYSQISG